MFAARMPCRLPTQALETLLVLLLTVLFLGPLLELGYFDEGPALPKASRHGGRLLLPRTPTFQVTTCAAIARP